MKAPLGTTAAALVTLVLSATALSAQQPAAATDSSTTAASAAPASSTAAATAPAPATAPVIPAAAATTPTAAASTYAYAKIRIVRLSEVKGAVQIDRRTGAGFETAMANLPIIEGTRLKTEVGVAEVEFEDNSTLRLAPGSLVEFPRLELLPSGAKASTVKVLQGMAYVSLTKSKDNELTLLFGPEQLRLQPASHIRLQVQPAEAKLAVWDGTALVAGPAGTAEVGKKKTATFSMLNANQPVAVAKNVSEDQFDTWDRNSMDYHQRYAASSALASSPYSYGTSDMMYYGSFMNAGGCGSMWRPYFVSSSWDPYSNGAWAYYSGAGYSWVSPYPWGWTPYHYGSWNYCPGAGWGWQPGGSWNGINNIPVATATSVGLTRRTPVRFPQPPRGTPTSGKATLVPVNTRQLTASTLTSDRFTFQKDSAGLGVPRGSLGKLDKFSQQVAAHGAVSAPVFVPGQTPRNGTVATAQPGARGPQSGAMRGSSGQMSANQGAANQGSMNRGGGFGGPSAGPVMGGHMSTGGPAPSGGTAGGGSRH